MSDASISASHESLRDRQFDGPQAIATKPVKVAISRGWLASSAKPKELTFEIRGDVAGKRLLDLSMSDIKDQIKSKLSAEGAQMMRRRVNALVQQILEDIPHEYRLDQVKLQGVRVDTSTGGLFSSPTYITVDLQISGAAAKKPLLGLSKKDIKDQINTQLHEVKGKMSKRRLDALAKACLRLIKNESTVAWKRYKPVVEDLEKNGPNVMINCKAKNGVEKYRRFAFLDDPLEEAARYDDKQLKTMVRAGFDANAKNLTCSDKDVEEAVRQLRMNFDVYNRYRPV